MNTIGDESRDSRLRQSAILLRNLARCIIILLFLSVLRAMGVSFVISIIATILAGAYCCVLIAASHSVKLKIAIFLSFLLTALKMTVHSEVLQQVEFFGKDEYTLTVLMLSVLLSVLWQVGIREKGIGANLAIVLALGLSLSGVVP